MFMDFESGVILIGVIIIIELAAIWWVVRI